MQSLRQPLHTKTVIALVFDALLLIVCILRFPSLLRRADVPFRTAAVEGDVVITSLEGNANTLDLRVGDRLLEWNGKSVISSRHVELLAGMSTRGDQINVRYVRGDLQQFAKLSLPAYYDTVSLTLLYIVAACAFVLGVYVLLKRSNDQRAVLLHGALVALSAVMVVAWPACDQSNRLGFLNSFLFFASYAGLSGSFFLFSLSFPQENIPNLRYWLVPHANHVKLSEVLIGFESLPFEGSFPVVKELACPSL